MSDYVKLSTVARMCKLMLFVLSLTFVAQKCILT